MKLTSLMPLIIFIAISALLALGLTIDPRMIPSTKIDQPAPHFSLPLLSEPQRSFSPADLRGQTWVLNVWASWCVACRVEHPVINQLAASGVTVVGLNYKDDASKAAKWLAERGNPYIKSVMDVEGLAGIEWGVVAVPETFVIDENGIVVFKHTGPVTAEIAQNEIRSRALPNVGTSPKQGSQP